MGVIDVGFGGFSKLMRTELPATVQTRCYTDIGVFNENLADCAFRNKSAGITSVHGTAVAEAVIDIAPEVSLYIANPMSWGDLQAAADWMVSEGVSVINHSVGRYFDGPSDETSWFSDGPRRTVDRAVNGEIIWVNSVGNEAYRAWFKHPPYPDADGDGLIDFAESDESNDMMLEAGNVITVDLRWDDNWGEQPVISTFSLGMLPPLISSRVA